MTTHLDNKNNPTMVDVNNKDITTRIATAQGEVKFSNSVLNKIKKMKTKKGGIENVAILAGIMGSKKQANLFLSAIILK